ncbi:MAG: OmpA family protein [Bacteroidales bacterium]|nr:OmpA family protein [Bacteroidales bacterium]NLM91572.1 OmpA family protein [Bacteroidales bacterium]
MNRKLFVIMLLASVMAGGCVSARKYQDMEARYLEGRMENDQLMRDNRSAENRIASINDEMSEINRQYRLLVEDTMRLGTNIRNLTANYEALNRTYALVQEQNEKLLEGRASETQQILGKLQETQEDLQRREDELREKEQNLNRLMGEFAAKEARVNELESILNRQEAVVQELRRTVSSALLGFENNGLTVETRNGKVYVSLEESLLFASGSTTVDSKGESALKELAQVLERNPDISVMIEGHTDDVPLRPGASIRDNWDLSVLRATAIVRILLKHGSIEPERFIVAGRGEHLPIDPAKTAEARRKNRRTEIILTPKLDALFQIIEMN